MIIKRLLPIILSIYGINSFASDADDKLYKNRQSGHMQADAVQISKKNMQTYEKVNVNTASADELRVGLHGIGKYTAKAIINYRDKVGKFKSLDDLKKVKNIGSKILEKNKDIIVFE